LESVQVKIKYFFICTSTRSNEIK